MFFLSTRKITCRLQLELAAQGPPEVYMYGKFREFSEISERFSFTRFMKSIISASSFLEDETASKKIH